MTNVAEYAFAYCPNLASVTIGNSVSSIGQSAFAYCTSLTNVTIPNSVVAIRAGAFEYCASLASVTLGTGINDIEIPAFGSCPNLTAVYFLGNAPSVEQGAFPDDPKATAYYLPGTTGFGTTVDGLPAVLVTLPAITLQPQSQTVNPGQNATLTVAATSAAPLSYQWFFNGAAIGGATTSSYTVIGPPEGGSYSVVVSNFGGSVTSAAAVLTVEGTSPATVTIVSGVTANNKLYDGTTSATLSSNNVVLAGVAPADAGNVALSTNGCTAAFASAGPGASISVTVSGLSLTGGAAGNYLLTQPILTANITAAPLLVSADDQARAFGHTNPAWTVSYRGFIGGDGPGSLGGTLSFSFTDTNVMSMPSIETNTTVGTYVVIPGGLTSGTYALTYAGGTLQITQAVLTVAVNPAAKVYGTANPAFSATISGFLDGDDASVVSGTPQLSASAWRCQFRGSLARGRRAGHAERDQLQLQLRQRHSHGPPSPAHGHRQQCHPALWRRQPALHRHDCRPPERRLHQRQLPCAGRPHQRARRLPHRPGPGQPGQPANQLPGHAR